MMSTEEVALRKHRQERLWREVDVEVERGQLVNGVDEQSFRRYGSPRT